MLVAIARQKSVGTLTTEGVALRDNNPAARGARERTIADKIEAIFGRSAELGHPSHALILQIALLAVLAAVRDHGLRVDQRKILHSWLASVDTPFLNYSRVLTCALRPLQWTRPFSIINVGVGMLA